MPEIEKPFRKTGDAAISESPLHPRRKSRRIMVGPVPVGGGAPITVQSMTNTLTRRRQPKRTSTPARCRL